MDFKRWVAPEALLSPQHAPKCEVWSFGIILWEIVTLGTVKAFLLQHENFCLFILIFFLC